MRLFLAGIGSLWYIFFNEKVIHKENIKKAAHPYIVNPLSTSRWMHTSPVNLDRKGTKFRWLFGTVSLSSTDRENLTVSQNLAVAVERYATPFML